jgi:hypothetical protein
VSDCAWADEVEAVTVAFVRGMALREVGDLLGFKWPSEREETFTEALWQQVALWEQADDPQLYPVQATEVDGWVVLIEPNGFQASLPATIAPLSRRGAAISVFWNVNRKMSVAVARDGVVVRSFDPLLFDVGAQGEPLPQEKGLPFGPRGAALPAALELAMRLTSVRIEKAWLLEARHRTWNAAGSGTT